MDVQVGNLNFRVIIKILLYPQVGWLLGFLVTQFAHVLFFSNLCHPPCGRGGPVEGGHGGGAGLLAAMVGDRGSRIPVRADLKNVGDRASADDPLRTGLVNHLLYAKPKLSGARTFVRFLKRLPSCAPGARWSWWRKQQAKLRL